jgi:hypothetical protein
MSNIEHHHQQAANIFEPGFLYLYKGMLKFSLKKIAVGIFAVNRAILTAEDACFVEKRRNSKKAFPLLLLCQIIIRERKTIQFML